MSMGKLKPYQGQLWIHGDDLKTPGHPFYERLNKAFDKHGFDRGVEDLCRQYYADRDGRPSIPPSVYFRMLLVGYFEGVGSERAIAWKCNDSLSVRAFLRLAPGESTPDHSSLSIIRRRLPAEVFKAFHKLVLQILKAEGLLKGRAIAIDSTTMAANAAMRSIVKKDTNESYVGYVKRLAKAQGEKLTTRADVARFDKEREGRTTSNGEWKSPTDDDARITKMKDGRTRLAYKPEHAVDLDSGAIIVATVNRADQSDHATATGTLVEVDTNLNELGKTTSGMTVVADKGYHSEALLGGCVVAEMKTCIAEPKMPRRRRWRGKPKTSRTGCLRNRHRVRSEYGKALLRRRGETVERSFAHVLERGGMRKTWLRGLENNAKRYWTQVAGFNLGLLMRKITGAGTPRALSALLGSLIASMIAAWNVVNRHLRRIVAHFALRPRRHQPQQLGAPNLITPPGSRSSTGC